MRLTSLLLPILLTAACGPTTVEESRLTTGEVVVCLGASTAPEDPAPEYEDQVWSVSGELVAQRPVDESDTFEVSDCWRDVERVLVVRDEDDVEWTLGWRLAVEDESLTRELPTSPGDPVSFDFVRMVVWGYDHGVVVRDGDGRMLLAGQEGMATDLDAAPGDPLGELSVSVGEAHGPTANLDCGSARNRTVVFEGEGEPVVLEAGERGTVDTGDAVLSAVNAGAFSYEGTMNCTDTWGPTPWMVWQESD